MLDKIVVLLIVAVVLVHTVVSTAAVDSVAKTNEDFIIVIGNNTDVIDIPITILPPDEEIIDQLEWLLFQYFDNDLCLENQQLYMQGIRQGTCFHDKSLVNIQSFQHDASVTSYRFTFPPGKDSIAPFYWC